MKKNKGFKFKGFTFIELLAAVTILGIISVIAISGVSRILERSHDEYYKNQEKNLILAAQSYMNNNKNKLPKIIGKKTKVTAKTLKEANYLKKDITEYDGKTVCDDQNTYVNVFKFGKTDYSNEFLYQNLWYKLGIESVGRTFNYDLNSIPKDNYSKMSWWSDYFVVGDNELNVDYPYLTNAKYHKLRKGKIIMNTNSYPLSWEMNGSEADYSKNLNEKDAYNSLSSPHSWSASELLLLLLDDSGDLIIK